MKVSLCNVEDEYVKNKELKKEDVQNLMQWAGKQPHLPVVSEFQAILFLHSCFYKMEAAKNCLENYYTIRTHAPEIFSFNGYDEINYMNRICLVTILPGKTIEGYRMIHTGNLISDTTNYDFIRALKLFELVLQLSYAQSGTCEGQILILNASNITMSHILKMNLNVMKKHTVFLQEAMYVRLKAVHVINTSPMVYKIFNMIKSFVRKDLMDLVYFHYDMESFYKYVPQEAMPNEYGGQAGTFPELMEKNRTNIIDNSDFLYEQQKYVVDESKRVGKSNLDELMGCGIEGTFKKLDID